MPVEPFELQHISVFLTQTEPDIRWVVDGVIPQGGITFLVAQSGTGKSMLAYDLAACVVTGAPWLGVLPVTLGGVAYVDLDGRATPARVRILAALRGHGIPPEDATRLPLFITARYNAYDIREPERRDAMLDTLAAVPDLRLVIFDTYSDLHRGEEASADDMLDTMAELVHIAAELGCGVLVVHHQRKGEGASLDDVRGSGAIIAKTDAVFFLKKERDEDGRPSLCTLMQRKARLTAEAAPRTLRMESRMEGETLVSYRWFATDEPTARLREAGRPATAMAEAMGIATRILSETPALDRSKLVRRLMDQGVSRATAYRVSEQIVSASQPSQHPMIWDVETETEPDPLPVEDVPPSQ